MLSASARVGLLLLAGLLTAACNKERPPKVPGETDLTMRKVVIQGEGGRPLALDPDPLFVKLGQRKGGLVFTHRYYNPFRLAEDGRRVRSYWQTRGWMDAEVLEPDIVIDEAKGQVEVTWSVREGRRYALATVAIKGAPEGTAPTLEALIPQHPHGKEYDLETLRIARYAMATELQRAGYGHARVYSRSYVDRAKKEVHQVWFCDPGPRTRIGKITVTGNRRVSAEDVRARLGLAEGEPYDLATKEKREFDLLDTGAFASVVIETTADTELYVGDVPDSGGVLEPDQIDDAGNPIPRKLADTIDLDVRVVEAPSVRLRAKIYGEVDPTRADLVTGGDLRLRNALGSQHHVSLEGRLGYGWLLQDDTKPPEGLYGDALVRYDRPGLMGRLGDFRLTARGRDVLYPGYHLLEGTAGPGVRTTAAPGLFFDLDLFARYGRAFGLGPFDAATRAEHRLPEKPEAISGEAQAAVLWDTRPDPIEPMKGHLLALRTSVAPVGTHTWGALAPDARVILPISAALSVGARASGAWIVFSGDDGVPLGPRLFGGGAYGMRGYGRQRFAPAVGDVPVGGSSLFEGSLELRWLPFQKQTGVVLFADVGGAGRRANPFERGVDLAVGLGPRVRIWYLPIGLDVGWLALKESRTYGDKLTFFVRIGEAF